MPPRLACFGRVQQNSIKAHPFDGLINPNTSIGCIEDSEVAEGGLVTGGLSSTFSAYDIRANKNVLNFSAQDASAALPQNCQTTTGSYPAPLFV